MPEVLAVGRFGPSKDAALVTRLPDGPALSEADDAALCDETLEKLLVNQKSKRARALPLAGQERVVIVPGLIQYGDG